MRESGAGFFGCSRGGGTGDRGSETWIQTGDFFDERELAAATTPSGGSNPKKKKNKGKDDEGGGGGG